MRYVALAGRNGFGVFNNEKRLENSKEYLSKAQKTSPEILSEIGACVYLFRIIYFAHSGTLSLHRDISDALISLP